MQERPPFLDNYLFFLLAVASHQASGDFHEELRQRSVRVSDWRVLTCLGDRDGLMINELVTLTFLEQPHVTKIVDRLQRDGLVIKVSDPCDRRRARVQITESGRAFLVSLQHIAKDYEEATLAKLTADEQTMIFNVLRKLVDKST